MSKSKNEPLASTRNSGLALHSGKDTPQGILIRISAAIMEQRYDTLEAIYNDSVGNTASDKRLVCLCILGLIHIINSKPITDFKKIVESGKRLQLHLEEIRNNEYIRKLDTKRYFVYSFDEIIDTFISKSLEVSVSEQSKNLGDMLLSLVKTDGIGRSFRFNLNSNLPNMIDAIEKTEKFFIDLNDLPLVNRDSHTLVVAGTFLDEGKYHILTEEKYFQPTSPSVSTTVMWSNYSFLSNNLFRFSSILNLKILEVCERRSRAWNFVEQFIARLWIKEKKTWYLADIRKRFKKEKVIAVVQELDEMFQKDPTTSIDVVTDLLKASFLKK